LQALAIVKLGFEPFDVYHLGYEELFEHFEEVVVTNALIDSSKTFFVLAEVVWKSEPDINLIRQFEFFDEVIEMTREGNHHLYMAIGHHLPIYSEIIDTMTSQFHCFIEYPLVYKKEEVSQRVVGEREDLRKYMDFLSDLGVKFRVEYIKDYHIKGRGILSELTDRQCECMTSAAASGYFEIPKRITLRKLASQMNITHGALAFHLRKAQRTIVRGLFD
jgi:predicted DNA binding protein